MAQIKVLKKLETDTEHAIDWLAAEYGYAKKLIDDLERIRKEEPKSAVRDLRRSFRIYRWLGRGERKINRFENRILEELEELGKILPPEMQGTAKNLKKQLEVTKAYMVKNFSLFTGEMRDELTQIKTEEQLLEKLKENEKLRMGLEKNFQEITREIKELEKWIASAQAILTQIESFEKKLKKMTA